MGMRKAIVAAAPLLDQRRAAVMAAAQGWIGTPYRHQAALKGVGCDCLGLIAGVWGEVTGEAVGPLPAYTPDWAEATGRETLAEGLRERMREIAPDKVVAGDVLLFRWRAHLPAKHAGIVSAPGRMIHAQECVAVTEVPLSGWWMRRAAFGFALLEPEINSIAGSPRLDRSGAAAGRPV